MAQSEHGTGRPERPVWQLPSGQRECVALLRPCLAAALQSAVFNCELEWPLLLPAICPDMEGTQTGRENQAVRAERGRMEVLEMAGGSSVT